ncbi:MAG: peptidoglycan-associated lipoprotein Pal [Acidobacteriota bacterium]
MSRKWWICAVLLLIVPLFYGCPRQAPVTPDDTMEVETTPVEEPAVEIEEPEVEVPDDVEENTLPSDIAELNEELKRRGLIGDVYFDFDKSDLSEEARERLANNAAFMRENPQYQFRVEGHCDERGTNEYNLALGQRRATTAVDYITSLGADGGNMTTISYGEERPFCTENSEGCWARNRRAHFVVTDIN